MSGFFTWKMKGEIAGENMLCKLSIGVCDKNSVFTTLWNLLEGVTAALERKGFRRNSDEFYSV